MDDKNMFDAVLYRRAAMTNAFMKCLGIQLAECVLLSNYFVLPFFFFQNIFQNRFLVNCTYDFIVISSSYTFDRRIKLTRSRFPLFLYTYILLIYTHLLRKSLFFRSILELLFRGMEFDIRAVLCEPIVKLWTR